MTEEVHDRIIQLNVGGQRFTTSESTLTWPGQATFFAALLSERIPSRKDESGAIFIDRDPKIFSIILNYLRTRDVLVDSSDLLTCVRNEALFFGITQLVTKVDLCMNRPTCGGLLFIAKLPAPFAPQLSGSNTSQEVVALAGYHNLIAVGYKFQVCCWSYGEAGGWERVAISPVFDRPVEKLAVAIKMGSRWETAVAVSMGTNIKLWEFHAQGSASSPPVEPLVATFNLKVAVDELFFIGSQLLATSRTGKIGVRNAVTQTWQLQDMKPILSHDRAGSLLLLGCGDGSIYYIDLEKFPLRMKDNDLLVNHLYSDPNGEGITALSVYFTASASSDKCFEIAYGTTHGTVRVIIQHPETVGQPPLLFQTYSVHSSPIKRVMLSEKLLISVCEHDNHVRTWKVARFRGRISTQPGSIPLASFNVATLDPRTSDVGPFGDSDQQQVFLQKIIPRTNQVLVRHAANGARVCLIESEDDSLVTCGAVHECGITASRVGARARRFLLTGHVNGTTQVWDLTTALDLHTGTSVNKPIRQHSRAEMASPELVDDSSNWTSLINTLDTDATTISARVSRASTVEPRPILPPRNAPDPVPLQFGSNSADV